MEKEEKMQADENKEITLGDPVAHFGETQDGRVTVQVNGSAEDVARFIVRMLDALAEHWV